MNASVRIDSTRIAVPASLWIGGLWLRLGLVGALLSALGVATLLRDGASVVTALATIVAGAALAAFGYRRARRVIDAELPAATSRPAGGKASAGTGAAYGRAPSARSA